jgi:hypothetical protein
LVCVREIPSSDLEKDIVKKHRIYHKQNKTPVRKLYLILFVT